jgi:hypothetical protein
MQSYLCKLYNVQYAKFPACQCSGSGRREGIRIRSIDQRFKEILEKIAVFYNIQGFTTVRYLFNSHKNVRSGRIRIRPNL